jgi:alkanesulfonate monooxygenase SsuD/methylene tetrahydromethanopterin reductase-like flavin-dependent oxidoreductase (luciferase family)
VTSPSYGVALQGVDPPASFTAMVAEIESLGFDHLWVTDSSLHARNSYAYLTLAAVSSSRLRLGTAVTNPVTRHPAITAAAAATVDEVSGGRAILGIGAGDRPLLALGHKPCAPAELADAIEAIRALWSGDEVTVTAPGFTLDHARLRFDARPGLPIYVSASGPRTLELAGGLADGVILLVGLFPDAVTWALERIDRGAPAPAAHGAVRLRRDQRRRRRRAGGRPIDCRLVPADRPLPVHAGRAARRYRRGRPGQLRGRRVPGSRGRRAAAPGRLRPQDGPGRELRRGRRADPRRARGRSGLGARVPAGRRPDGHRPRVRRRHAPHLADPAFTYWR